MKPSEQAQAQAARIALFFNAIVASGMGADGRADRMDADETNMLALQLEVMRAKVYATEYPEQKARQYIPVTNEDDPAAESIAYEETDEAGEAALISNYADDLPTVESKGEKISFEVRAYGVAYTYTLQDIRRAAFSGKPLRTKKAVAAMKAWERKLDTVAFQGDPDAGIAQGFGNHGSVGIETLAAAGTWATKTAQQMLDDLNKLVSGFITTSEELHEPTDLVLPTAQFLLMNQTRMSTDNGETVMAAFLTANPTIQRVGSWNKLDGAGAGGLDRMVAYKRDSDVLELVIPQEFEVFPPQPKNLAFNVPCHGRTAGTHLYRPLGMRYMDGI